MHQERRSILPSSSGIQGAAFAGLILWMVSAWAQQPALPTTKLSAGIHVIQAEVASTMGTRSQGLMQRKSMAQGAGMLFLFTLALLVAGRVPGQVVVDDGVEVVLEVDSLGEAVGRDEDTLLGLAEREHALLAL